MIKNFFAGSLGALRLLFINSCAIAGLLCLWFTGYGQTYEDQYRQPLKAVLKMIESKFKVKLNYNDALVKDRMVAFAGWRLKSDLKTTLNNVLAHDDLVSYPVNDTVYNIEPFQYWQQSVEEGKQQLSKLWDAYGRLPDWEKRKAELRACIFSNLGLQTLPPSPASKPITTTIRKWNGYTVQNVAIETLPGLFVCGSIYKPSGGKGKMPVVLSPNGHFAGGRYRSDQQYRCATLARMGAIVFSYDLLGWGESRLQFEDKDHYTSMAMVVQTLNSFRILDYLSSLTMADTSRIGITGASGGGSQTMLMTALTDRIKVSAPVVMLSCYYAGGCPCETGIPIHFCGNGTNNAEIAAMAAPRPQLIVSDGQDWTDHVPSIEYPYLQSIYGLYDKSAMVENVHLNGEGHDYGFSKRKAMYEFMAKQLHLNLNRAKNAQGEFDEAACTIEEEPALYVFGKNGEGLPRNAKKGIEQLQGLLNKWLKH